MAVTDPPEDPTTSVSTELSAMGRVSQCLDGIGAELDELDPDARDRTVRWAARRWAALVEELSTT